MKTLLLALVLACGCAGSLVDQLVGASGNGGDGGTPTQACLNTCTSTSVPNAAPLCIGDACTYECQGGKLKCGSGCCDATAISAGASHTCAVAGGEARCWGANDQGQLGRAGASSFVPVQASAIASAVAGIAAGSKHTCAIAAGEVWCWGDNTFGQLGNGQSGASTGGPTPHKVPNLSGILRLATGGGHTCAADASTTYCWGRGDQGQLGDGSTSSAPQTQPKAVPSLSGVIALALGDAHTCAATGSNALCWGANGAGQIGIGAGKGPAVTTPTAVGFSGRVVGLGANHSCAIDASGALSCWGANGSAQIDTSLQDQFTPKGVMSGTLAVAGGVGHTCILTNKQTLTCLGLNDDGQLGAAGATLQKGDVSLSGVSALAAGAKHNCALVGGTVLCWGLNDLGQLGADPAAAATSATPLPVSGR